MTEVDRTRQAADVLMLHMERGTRLDHLPDALRPSTRADGYAIQSQWQARSTAPLFGWKIAATSEAGQRHINVDGPLAGRLLRKGVLADGATVSLANNLMRVAELELAFSFGRDLPSRPRRYEVDEVMAAVATLHPAIEIPDSRFEDFCAVGAPQLIADNACARWFILGPAVDMPWRHVDLAAHEVSATVVGKSQHEGKGSNVLGDPRLALTWLVNELSAHGVDIRAGQVVTTGTCVVPVPVVPGDVVRASFGEFGRVSARFS
jgi:2-keto-4-pentenoate hydratase